MPGDPCEAIESEIKRLNDILGRGGSEAVFASQLATAYRGRAQCYLSRHPTLTEPLSILYSKAAAALWLSTEWYERVNADDEVATNEMLKAGIFERIGQLDHAESSLEMAVSRAKLKKSECERALDNFRKRHGRSNNSSSLW